MEISSPLVGRNSNLATLASSLMSSSVSSSSLGSSMPSISGSDVLTGSGVFVGDDCCGGCFLRRFLRVSFPLSDAANSRVGANADCPCCFITRDDERLKACAFRISVATYRSDSNARLSRVMVESSVMNDGGSKAHLMVDGVQPRLAFKLESRCDTYLWRWVAPLGPIRHTIASCPW